MVYRLYTEKKEGLDNEADRLCSELKSLYLMEGLTRVRILKRYDVENLDERLFDESIFTVFAEPQLDKVYTHHPMHDEARAVFAVEYLPGQYDQRADSAAQCIQLISQKERPIVKTAKVYYLYGELTDEQVEEVKHYVINPVESRECGLGRFNTLKIKYEIPETVRTLDGFTTYDDSKLMDFVDKYALAMDEADLRCCRDYFAGEKRDPTLTEIRMLDTYWSDHCRHTTFLTHIEGADIKDPDVASSYKNYLDIREKLGRSDRPVTLMDIATIGAKYLKKTGQLQKLDESEEINACTVRIDVEVDGRTEKWLLLFKNETHNHPTEIEPFGGAATCIGGAIRDPLSGRAYVYQAMRITGAADPLVPVADTIPGKLPQRKIVTTAAAGFSSYGNQIGLATGIVDEIYDPGYAAKRMEIGAVIAAVPAKNVRREVPAPGDIVILLGGRTGRDGCGGATGSSKSHNSKSLETCGAEVQKGNAPEERKLQRLFRSEKASSMIKRCNDFGAGGVCVAIGELADGLEIDLNAVPKKYEGLDGTELAISESQERMAVVLAPEDVDEFRKIAGSENIESTVVAVVTKQPRLVMNWNGRKIVDISREFIDKNGAPKSARVSVDKLSLPDTAIPSDIAGGFMAVASDLNVCSKRGLSEMFDSTIGAGTVLMPFGGKYQRSPAVAMAAKIPVLHGHTDDCSVMAWGFDPSLMRSSSYHGAYCSVAESLCRLVCTGAPLDDCYLTFQEYFEKPGEPAERWGKPFSALLGALDAQLDFGVGSIGGKDSMSGTFEDLDVPPTLVSFAVTMGKASGIISPEFKRAGSKVYLVKPRRRGNGLPDAASLKEVFTLVHSLISSGKVVSACTQGRGGIAASVIKMAMGNRLGLSFEDNITAADIFGDSLCSFILEAADGASLPDNCVLLGQTVAEYEITACGQKVCLYDIQKAYDDKLESVYRTKAAPAPTPKTIVSADKSSASPAVHTARPKVVIPVFPGTNCEYDTARAFSDAGAEPQIVVVNNLTSASVSESVEVMAKAINEAQMIFIPGGFSGGDEPDGSGKFITSFFRNPKVAQSVNELLSVRYGLMGGICNGFQALIKLGLVPYGEIRDTDPTCPTLTFNTIGRHVSTIVRVRVASALSPWLSGTKPGEVFAVPVSHGEGRFICSEELFKDLAYNGQIATQYCDPDGNVTGEMPYDPNGSFMAVEGITSADGRVFGKMGHCERYGKDLYKNVGGNYDMKIFDSAVGYFK